MSTKATKVSAEEKERQDQLEEKRERARVAKMSDTDVMKATDNGRFGPGIVGKALAERSAKLVSQTGGGIFGPAITDPDYAAKQAALKAAARAAEADADEPEDRKPPTRAAAPATKPSTEPVKVDGQVDPTDLKDPKNPWSFVTRSGAKMLAQKHGISYVPTIGRDALIAILQEAKVVPPDAPTEEELKKTDRELAGA